MKLFERYLPVIALAAVRLPPSVAVSLETQATQIVVRAKARDGKFIGSSIGGARVRIGNADSGAAGADQTSFVITR